MENEIKKARKPRVKKTMAERIAENAKRQANLAWDLAKDALVDAGLQNIVEVRANLMRYARECENLANPEYVAEQKAKLLLRLANLDARAAIAGEFAPRAKATLDKVENLFIRIGGEISDALTKGETVDAREIVNAILTDDDKATLADSADPFVAFRRKRSEKDSPEDMPDSDTDTETSEDDDDDIAGE